MADLTRRPNDRAQLLIGAAIGIAILLTALALALNTAAYGAVHVSQTDNSRYEERGAVQYQHGVERAAAGLIAANAGNETEYEALERDLRADLERWDALSKRERAVDEAVTSASIAGVAFESRIVQDERDTFTDRSDRPSWTVVGNTSELQTFELRIHDDELSTADDCVTADCFTLEIEGDDAGAWRLFANTTSGGEGVTITVESPDGSTETCETEESAASINVTAGRFDDGAGTECSFAPPPDAADPPYTIRYANADRVTGTYDLTASGRVVEDTVAEDDRYGTTGSPRIEPAIATATVAIEYRSPDLTYRTEVRIDGGDADA